MPISELRVLRAGRRGVETRLGEGDPAISQPSPGAASPTEPDAEKVAVVTVLLALPLGYLARTRLVANTTYAVAYLWAFVFRTLYLLLDGSALRSGDFPWSYGLVTATVLAVGFGLVAIGHGVRRHRTAQHPVPITHRAA